ncbi:MAG: preprotein translocase subunit YajC [Puniceicoccales bacterium]|jgi:preprotein translocase subunit YajC|nr:preprotein translocase subunit YajC [Puniceicoccales bacterium]
MASPMCVGEAAAGARSGGTSQIWIFALIFLAIWFLSIAPAKKRQKQRNVMLNRLRPGDRVLLSSAIFGKIVTASGKRLTVEVSKGVRIDVLRDGVRQLVDGDCEAGDGANGGGDGDGLPQPSAGGAETLPDDVPAKKSLSTTRSRAKK